MIKAGRVLIIPKGEWTNLEPYEMLDLVTCGDIAYIARQASVGVDPATDTQLTYWQPFGTAAKIATTSVPGIVMPDGTTITIDETGLITADLGVSDLNNVTISSIANGQILQYNSTTQKFENKSLGTAASRNATSAITSGSTDLIESGAVSSLKQTLETALGNKVNTSDIANNLTTTTAGKVLDATQGKALNDSISTTNTAITNKHKVTSVQVTTSGWTADTTSQSGTTLYKKSISLSHVYVDSPSVDIGAASGSTLPTTAQQTAYDLLQYVTVDGTTMYLYGSDIPTDAYYINVEGVD
jgi:hypothetical protein